jgi:hypothetical protein
VRNPFARQRAATLEADMAPWKVEEGRGCPSDAPYAVVKEQNGEVVACHATREQATRHLQALYANEPDASIETTPIDPPRLAQLAPSTAEANRSAWEAEFGPGWAPITELQANLLQALYANEPDASIETTPIDPPRMAQLDGGCWQVGAEQFERLEDAARAFAALYPAQGIQGKPFTVFLAPEGVESRDGRMLEPGTTECDDSQPMPLMVQDTATHGEGDPAPSWFAGAITSTYRDPRAPHRIMGRGNLLLNEDGNRAETLIRGGMRGVSIDGYGLLPPSREPSIVDQHGNTVGILTRFANTRIMGATVVPHPAFQDCCLWFDDENEPSCVAANMPDEAGPPDVVELPDALPTLPPGVLLASAAPAKPPKAWFYTPEPNDVQPLKVEGGRISGHLAPYGQCHIGYGGCWTAPKSKSGYRFFHIREAETAEGERVPCGVLTLRGGHHDDQWATPAETIRHYDDSDSIVAKVRVIDGRYGPWVAGALRPFLSEDDLWLLLSTPMSGDWRECHDGRRRLKDELVAILCVPTPGFPIARPEVRVASGARVGETMPLGALSFVAPARDTPNEGANMTGTQFQTSNTGNGQEPCEDCGTEARIAALEERVEQITAQMLAMQAGLAASIRDPARAAKVASSLAKIDASTAEVAFAASGDTSAPLADKGTAWDGGAAEASIWAWAKDDWGKAARCFLWHADNPSKRGDFKFPFARIVNGSPQIVPKAIYAAAGRLDQSDIPAADKAGVKGKLNALYKRLGEKAPWDQAAGAKGDNPDDEEDAEGSS